FMIRTVTPFAFTNETQAVDKPTHETLPNRRQTTVVPGEVRELGRRNGLLRRCSSRERHASLGNEGPGPGHSSGERLRAFQGEPLSDRRRAALHSHQGKSPKGNEDQNGRSHSRAVHGPRSRGRDAPHGLDE